MHKYLSSDLLRMQLQDYVFVFASFRYSDIRRFKDHARHNHSIAGFEKLLYLLEIQEKFIGAFHFGENGVSQKKGWGRNRIAR